ncbi:probable basic-leucine zipper transcription factor E isoform X2 [Bactrocera dorsalis]|uniref:Probable basic-leucine zipper transcription factor E isoform X2 n=2 Tax=Bactrocera dorsalis TaxID=27457 RepID=A0A6I9UKP6_BACDO|nr:probable basic-leucine zipper transcription factor E isoform X2 [Bactrocera dorsalis]
MSQNQSYFWQTTKHNVFLKRSARLQMLIALMAVLTFSTICQAEVARKEIDDNVATLSAPSAFPDNRQYVKDAMNGNAANDLNEADATKEPKTNSGFIDAFSASISVILFTELGDKTFFIAAIMAMRHPRLIVFAGAISALALMTVLSVVFGMAATIIPKVYTYYISTALFAIFGLKMIYEGYFMKDSDAQEELEEVQSTLRKREDELMRKRSKYDDADAKRKNSNSDKEDECLERGAGVTANNSIDNDSNITTTVIVAHSKNPDMSHRQRKHNNHNNNNNINNQKIGCDVSKDAADSDNSSCHENDIFLKGVNGVSGVGVGVAAVDNMKSTNFHSSPALSASVLSNQTEQTNCDEFTNSPNKLNFKSNNDSGDDDGIDDHHNIDIIDGGDDDNATVDSGHGGTPIHGKRAKQTKTGTSNSITSLNSLNLNAKIGVGAGETNGELKQLGGSKKRLERSASLVQDPESGVVRKNAKKSATHMTMRILMQAFTMTFLAEWGDRSQLTTIILAASKNVYGVITGGIIGHSICTGLAVIGGRMVAAKISVRTVTIIGGIVFVGFAVYALIVKPDDI